MFKVVLVNSLDPKSKPVVCEVSADKWRDAMRSAEAKNPEYIAVEAERITA